MEYTVTFELLPPGPFGLPQEDYLVLPGAPGEIFGPAYQSRSGTRVGYGTLPQYRAVAEAISLHFESGTGLSATVRDNILLVKLNAVDHDNAVLIAEEWTDRFAQHACVLVDRHFSFRLLLVECENGNSWRGPHRVDLLKVTTYNLRHLEESLEQAAKAVTATDERLRKALDYF